MLKNEFSNINVAWPFQDQISPIVHMDLMKEALDEENVPYQAFTMSKLGHTFGRPDDIKAHAPVLKDFLFNEL